MTWLLMTSETGGPKSKEGALGTGLGASGDGDRMGNFGKNGRGIQEKGSAKLLDHREHYGPWVFEPLGELYG